MNRQQFSKTNTLKYNSKDDVVFLSIALLDKIILCVQINGIMDTTFDVPISTNASVRQTLINDNTENIDDSGIEPKVLMGQVNNIKLEIVVTQIGKLILTSSQPKSLIITIGSRWFGNGDEHETEDFDKLMFILEGVKLVLP